MKSFAQEFKTLMPVRLSPETPDRFQKAMDEMLSGYEVSALDLLKTFKDTSDEMVIVRNIDFVSVCEHHLLPVVGVAHFGYLPNGRVVGLSKIPRLVDMFARRLQLQERMTSEIVNTFRTVGRFKDCGCIVVAKHGCVGCRGVRKPDVEMVTSCLVGKMRKKEAKHEFLRLCGL